MKITSRNALMTAGTIFLVILSVLAIVGIILLTQASRGYAENNKSITVSGTSEVFAEPDIAEFSFTVRADAKTVADAQQQVTDTTNALLAQLQDNGIDEDDIKTTGYYSNPRYEYQRSATCIDGYCPDGKQVIVGYELSHTIVVTVRDLDKVSDVLVTLGSGDVDNINGPSFRIDDEDALRARAREQAIDKARAEAQQLAESLDVKLGRMINYYESGDDFYPTERGYFGDAMVESVAMDVAAPSLPTGENKITATVNITYRIK